jgi:hypothetical protein
MRPGTAARQSLTAIGRQEWPQVQLFWSGTAALLNSAGTFLRDDLMFGEPAREAGRGADSQAGFTSSASVGS